MTFDPSNPRPPIVDQRGRTLVDGPCSDCGEETYADDPRRCRDCDIQTSLDAMQCPTCKRMKYRSDEPSATFARSLWGERCECSGDV